MMFFFFLKESSYYLSVALKRKENTPLSSFRPFDALITQTQRPQPKAAIARSREKASEDGGRGSRQGLEPGAPWSPCHTDPSL